MEKILYLHWGPGGNAQAELKALSRYSADHFFAWTQPTISAEQPRPYLTLVQAVLDQVTEIYNKNGTPLHLFGHSFGALLALEAAKRVPNKISRLTLIAALPSVAEGYTRLGKRLAEIYRDEAIAKASFNFSHSPSFETFVSLFQTVTQYPDFLLHYWGKNADSQAARELFFKIAETTPMLNFETFTTVMKDLFESYLDSSYQDTLKPAAHLPVEIHLGNEDPYLDIAQDSALWKSKIPQAKIVVHPAGHFVHLESKML